jgi:phosphoribosylformylglycinamidine cyclo-ligase
MLRTFNCGLGMILVVPPHQAQAVADTCGGQVVGEIVEGDGVEIVE